MSGPTSVHIFRLDYDGNTWRTKPDNLVQVVLMLRSELKVPHVCDQLVDLAHAGLVVLVENWLDDPGMPDFAIVVGRICSAESLVGSGCGNLGHKQVR